MTALTSIAARGVAIAALFVLGIASIIGSGGGGGGNDTVPLSIVSQPVDQSVLDGTTASFGVIANSAQRYQWQRLEGGSWVDIAGATSSAYTFGANLAQNNLQLRVVVSDASSSITSRPVTLTVTTSVVPASITVEPANVTANAGLDAVFTVAAAGTSPSYRWESSPDGTHWSDVPNGNAYTLILSPALESDNGKSFRVTVSNAGGSVVSRAVTLSVAVEFIVVSGGDACGGNCGGDSGDGSGVGAGDGGSGSAGPGLSAMRNARATVYKPDGQLLGSAELSEDFLVSLYPRAYTGPFIVEFGDDGSGNGMYFDEAKRSWLALQGQKLHVMVPQLTHHISANPMTEAAYQWALRQFGSQAALTQVAMQQANTLMLAQLNAKLPSAYQTTDVSNFMIPLSSTSGRGALTNTWAGRYGAVMAALPIAGTLFDSSLASPALSFARQLTEDIKDDGGFNASAAVAQAAYDSGVANALSAGICTAVSIWGSPSLPSQLSTQSAGAAKAGQLTLLAGSAGGSGNCDGWASNARFDNPWRVAVDGDGNIYVADNHNHTIRKISPEGAVQTLAGSPGKSGTADGLGLAARFYAPQGIAADAIGNVFVTDGSSTIRKITRDGLVSTLAGSPGALGNADGVGAGARFSGPADLALDTHGNVYVADSLNNAIRKVTPQGVVTTLAISSCGSNSLSNPSGIAVDSADNLYISNLGGYEVCKVNPDGTSTFFADGQGSSDGSFQEPRGLAVDKDGNVYLADAFNEIIRKITPQGDVSTLAGRLVTRGSADGFGTDARFRRPNGVAVDSHYNVYVADEENHTIRKISSDGEVSTLAGLASNFGYADGTGGNARFQAPGGSAVDSQGNMYVADALNYVIRKITPAGVVTTLAGTPGVRGNSDGVGSNAQFRFISIHSDSIGDTDPVGLCIDRNGNLYVADTGNNSVRKVTPAGEVTTIATVPDPRGIAADPNGNVFVSNYSAIRRVTPQGVVTLFAGDVQQWGSADGQGTAARFTDPRGLAADAGGNIYVADTGNATIRRITSNGSVTTLAGTAGQSGTADATGSAARFSVVLGLAVDSQQNIYVADLGGAGGTGHPIAKTVRKVTPAGVVSTVVGKPGSAGNILGALPASLGQIGSVAVVSDKQLVITANDGVFLATFP